MGESPNPDWMNQWQALSRQYMNAWQDLSRNVATPPPAATPAWQEGFEQWARAFAPPGSGHGETIDRLVDSAKSYAAFMQAMLAGMANAPQGAAAPWGDAWRQGFASPGAASAMFEHPAARTWRGMQEQGSAGLAQLAGLLGHTPPAGDLAELKRWFGMPAFGVMREHQEHYQKSGLAWIEYQEQLGRYNTLMLEASRRGFELFEGKLAEREQPGRQIESLRGLYDLWVDAAEEGYAEVALSPRFREVYGALVNAQMRLRSQIQKEAERIAAELGMPTRSELNSIGERLQALRREVRARGPATADGLADEIATLREDLAALKATVKGRSASASKRAADVAPEAEVDGGTAPARRARKPAARKPRAAAAPRKTRREEAGERAVAATASGNFASRIEKFANASLGTAVPPSKRRDKTAESKKRKTKR